MKKIKLIIDGKEIELTIGFYEAQIWKENIDKQTQIIIDIDTQKENLDIIRNYLNQ